MPNNKEFRYDEFVLNVKHCLKKIRCNALDELEKFSCDDVSKLCTPDNNYMKILIELLNDEAEICREKSLKLIFSYINAQKMITDEFYASILLTIEKRIGTETVEESSEEIRCMLLKVLSLSVEKSQIGVVESFIRYLMNIILNSLNDQNSEVRRCAFDLVVKVATEFATLFNQYSSEVVTVLLSCTKHKHFRVRSGSVDALRLILIYCSKDIISHVCGSMGECLLDYNVNVRISVLRASAHWMQVLTDRYSYTPWILPLILSSYVCSIFALFTFILRLLDESVKCREEAYDLWDKIGLKYLEDEKEKMKDKDFQSSKRTWCLELDVQIPNDGCSALVRKELDKILPTVVVELDDWKNEVRSKSAALLKIIVVHAGLSIVPFLDLLFPAMLKKCCDQDTTVSQHVTEIARYIGGTVPAAVYWKVFVSHLKNGFTSNHLILLASLMKTSNEAETFELANEIINVFVDTQTCTCEAGDQKYKLEIICKLLHRRADCKLNETSTFHVYKILLSTLALTVDDCEESKVFELMEILCCASEFQSTKQLNELYFGELFPRLLESCSIWEAHSIDFKMFIALLSRFTDDVFLFAAETLTRIFEIILNFEFDKDVIFYTLLIIAKLIENDNLDVNKHFEVMETILSGPLKKLLIWRSGKVVEVIRNAALTIVDLCMKRILALPATFIEEFTSVLISLCEDNYLDTRKAAVHALGFSSRHLRTKKIEPEFFVKMLTAAVMRLEDENSQVRLVAISAIQEIFFISHLVQIEKNWPEFEKLHKLMELIVVMSSDENVAVRNALQDLLIHRMTSDFLKRQYSNVKLEHLANKCSDEDFTLALKTYWKI